MDSPYAVDLFSGAGGFTLRLKRSGLPVAIAVDSERNAARTYRRNHPEVHLLERCVTEVTPAGMLLDPEHSPLLIAAGPPCQGYSIAGKRDATDPRNDLFLEVLRLAAAVRPPFVAIENVPGMKWVGEVRFADRMCRSLRDMGYHIERPHLLSLDPPFGVCGCGDVGVLGLWSVAGGGFVRVREVLAGFGRFLGVFGRVWSAWGRAEPVGDVLLMVCLVGSVRGQQSCGRLRTPARAV